MKRLTSTEIKKGLVGYRYTNILASESDTGKRLISVSEIKECFGELIELRTYQFFTRRNGECRSFDNLMDAMKEWDKV